MSAYEKQLRDMEQEEQEGYKLKINAPGGQKKGNNYGWSHEDEEDNDIEEDIEEEGENQDNKGMHLLESGGGG